MQVLIALPPNYDEIAKAFHFTSFPSGRFAPVFAYGEVIYNPMGNPISADLMIHEETHARQQANLGSVEQWWRLYIDNAGFRLRQEIEAYQAQWNYIKANYNRAERRSELQRLATDFSSALYGNIINKKDAEEIIQNG